MSTASENKRSNATKKPPFVDFKLIDRINKQREAGRFGVINTYSRRSVIVPKMIGATIGVHNGKVFVPVNITENMIGKKLGEFSPTRTYRGHGDKKSDKKSNKG